MENILKQHGIKTKTVDGRLLALDEWTRDGVYECGWVDVTDYTKKQIMDFLNY